MNEKQVKLLRYFAKHTGDLPLAGETKARWETLSHKKKGQLTRWMKKAIVTMMAIAKHKKREAMEQNKKTLEGFFSSGIVDANGREIQRG